MKRILVPTDFSQNAWNALQYATQVFEHEECTFFILNVFSVSYASANLMVPEPGITAYDISYEKSQIEIQTLVNRPELRNPRHTFEGISKINFLYEEIHHLTEEKGIDMIVMGTRGIKSSSKFGIGSNTYTIMEKITDCPILAVPENCEFHGFKEILFPTSFDIAYKSNEISPFISFIKDFTSTVRILNIREEDNLTLQQEDHRKKLEEDLTGLEYTFHTLTGIDPAMGIKCFSQSRNIDLIALISRKHNIFYKLMNRNILKDINYEITIPLLVMHHQ
ncbi:universal stress protein [Robertkochia solimangrovi]|uniref:universal stress protein n=1 Tax=Robertkochia solimangrovi TaxID=2213046 RepID=UPI0013A58EFD|nr:universal stress protein [Robertkochia solimangrovi]